MSQDKEIKADLEGEQALFAAACREPLEIHVKLLAGVAATSAEQALLATHLASCESCRTLHPQVAETHSAIQNAYADSKVSAGFAQRTLARLARTAEPVGSQPGLKVYSAHPPRRYWKAGLAAAIVAAILTIPIVRMALHSSSIKGQVVDENGQDASEIRPGVRYTVKQDAVFPLGAHTRVKAQAGTQFQLATADAGAALNLKNGELYAGTKDNREPLKISCSAFETNLQAGDFYVAGQESGEPRGVIIVFRGFAQVTANDKESLPLPLVEGQIFVTSGRGDTAYRDTLNIDDMRTVKQKSNANRAGQVEDYQQRVDGYRQEMKDLKDQLAQAGESQRAVELRERLQRVKGYLDAHQRKLNSLEDDFILPFPFDEIDRGLNGHSDPSTWM